MTKWRTGQPHTAPWTLYANGNRTVFMIKDADPYGGNVVVTVSDLAGAHSRAEASARLIAAAPDLLEAATHAEAVMAIVRPRSDTAEYLAAMHELRAAILKAAGAAP